MPFINMFKKSRNKRQPVFTTLPPAQYKEVSVCCISLNVSDRIRLLGCPPDLVSPIRETIRASWGSIKSESALGGAHEFKLWGNPWYGQGKDAVTSRRLLTALLRTMAKLGWALIQASDVTKKEGDKDTLFFEAAVPDPEAQLFSISFNRSDRIRVIDATAFVPLIKAAVQSHWRLGIKEERDYHGAHELKLNGNPWYASGEGSVRARMICAQMYANLRAQGYKLYGSVDISYGVDASHDLDTWVFRRLGSSWQ